MNSPMFSSSFYYYYYYYCITQKQAKCCSISDATHQFLITRKEVATEKFKSIFTSGWKYKDMFNVKMMTWSSGRRCTSYRFNIRSTTVEKQRLTLPDKKNSRKSNSIQQAL